MNKCLKCNRNTLLEDGTCEICYFNFDDYMSKRKSTSRNCLCHATINCDLKLVF